MSKTSRQYTRRARYSEGYEEIRACPQMKIPYDTYRIALQQAARAFKKDCSVILRAYKCPHCKKWHLTSQFPHTEDPS